MPNGKTKAKPTPKPTKKPVKGKTGKKKKYSVFKPKRKPRVSDAANLAAAKGQGPLWITGTEINSDTMAGGKSNIPIVQRWVDMGLQRLRDFSQGRGKYIPKASTVIYERGGQYKKYRNYLSAAEVKAAAQKVVYAVDKLLNTGQKVPISFNRITRGGKDLEGATKSKAEIIVNPRGNEGNFAVGQTVIHEMFHRYGDVPEEYISCLKHDGTWEKDPKNQDFAQDITDQFFATNLVKESVPPPLGSAKPTKPPGLKLASFCLSATRDGSKPFADGVTLNYRRRGKKYVLDEEAYLVAKFSGPFKEYFKSELVLSVHFKAREWDVGRSEFITENWSEKEISSAEVKGGYCWSAFNASWLHYLVPPDKEDEAEDELDVRLKAWCEIKDVTGDVIEKLEPAKINTSKIKIKKKKLEFLSLFLSRKTDGSQPLASGTKLKYHQNSKGQYELYKDTVYLVAKFSEYYKDFFGSDHDLEIKFQLTEKDLLLDWNEEYEGIWLEKHIYKGEQQNCVCWAQLGRGVFKKLVPKSSEAEDVLTVELKGSCKIKKGDTVLRTIEPKEIVTKKVLIKKQA